MWNWRKVMLGPPEVWSLRAQLLSPKEIKMDREDALHRYVCPSYVWRFDWCLIDVRCPPSVRGTIYEVYSDDGYERNKITINIGIGSGNTCSLNMTDEWLRRPKGDSRWNLKTRNRRASNSQDVLVKKASAVENLAAAHQTVSPLHSHGVWVASIMPIPG